MGFWKCKDGTEVEMIFDEQGNFVKFGDNARKEDIEKAKREIFEFVSGVYGKVDS